MSFLMIFLFMVFFHIVDDFYLQGCLAKFKQKRYWQDINNYPRTVIDEQLIMSDEHDKYIEFQEKENKEIRDYMHDCRYDFLMGLFLHSFSWTFMVTIPIMVTNYYRLNEVRFGMIFVANLLLHMAVDDMKSNKLVVTLLLDQTIHLLQIFLIFIFFRLGWLFY